LATMEVVQELFAKLAEYDGEGAEGRPLAPSMDELKDLQRTVAQGKAASKKPQPDEVGPLMNLVVEELKASGDKRSKWAAQLVQSLHDQLDARLPNMRTLVGNDPRLQRWQADAGGLH